MQRIPVILDTDIGTDIDDTWALALLLKSPEVDLKLAVSTTGDTVYRARLLAKLFEAAGRVDIPVGVGLPLDDASREVCPQAGWLGDYDLARYPGKVHADGVGALIETIMMSPEPVTLLGIGPLPNIAAALQREPRIAQRARFVGMHGSLRLGYDGNPQIAAEYNVMLDPAACRAVFAAPWQVSITPVDTCGLVRLTGETYARVRDSHDPLARLLIENYRIWRRNIKVDWVAQTDPEASSTTIFAAVAAYMCFAEDWLVMESLGVRVDDEGYTRIDPTSRPIRCATGWKDLPAFEQFLAKRLSE
jgi:inosine-uridine nucleoside N-ribohydrolase